MQIEIWATLEIFTEVRIFFVL